MGLLRWVVAVAVVCCLGLNEGAAQSADMRWGSIPDEHLAALDFPADPNAQAIVLGDVADVRIDNRGEVRFERHRRVKVLNEGGYDLGTITIHYDARDRAQRISGIRGQTFVTERGRTRRIQMGRDAVFTERLEGGYERVTFTLPALAPGAVFEFRYELVSRSPLQTPRWFFQDSEPTLWSEYRLEHPATLAYTFLSMNNPQWAVRTEERGTRHDGDTRIHRWAVANAPALRGERHMTAPADHRLRLETQLVEYLDPRIGRVRVLGSWGDLAATIEDGTTLSAQARPSRSVRQRAQELVRGIDEPEAQARRIYEAVRSEMTWNGQYDVFPSSDLGAVMTEGRGNAADINGLLVGMLREAGIEAATVLVSTRSSGRVIKEFPLVSQFNLSLAAARLNGSWVLLDATHPRRPFGVLPENALNGEAWMPGGSPEWVRLNGTPDRHHVHLDAELRDGVLVGTLRSEHEGYGAIDLLDALDVHAPDVVLGERVLNGGVGLRDVVLTPEEGKATFEAAFRIDQATQRVGDMHLLRAVPLFGLDESPFTQESRSFPVDFAFPRAFEMTAEIRLPDGFEIDEMPSDVLLRLPQQGGTFERTAEVREGVLHLSARRTIQRTIYQPGDYSGLKRHYDRMIAAEQDMVVLRPASAAALPSAAPEAAVDYP